MPKRGWQKKSRSISEVYKKKPYSDVKGRSNNVIFSNRAHDFKNWRSVACYTKPPLRAETSDVLFLMHGAFRKFVQMIVFCTWNPLKYKNDRNLAKSQNYHEQERSTVSNLRVGIVKSVRINVEKCTTPWEILRKNISKWTVIKYIRAIFCFESSTTF